MFFKSKVEIKISDQYKLKTTGIGKLALKNIESVIKNLPKEKNTGPDGFTGELILPNIFKEE